MSFVYVPRCECIVKVVPVHRPYAHEVSLKGFIVLVTFAHWDVPHVGRVEGYGFAICRDVVQVFLYVESANNWDVVESVCIVEGVLNGL